MTQRNRRRWIGLGLFIALLAGAYFAACAYVAHLLDHQLHQMVESHLNAELQIADLRYHFPYGVTLHDARLISRIPGAPSSELLHLRQVDLQLAELPHRNQPLLIEKFIVTDPSVHLVRTQQGMLDLQALLKERPQRPARKRLSDLFRLRRFAITGGRIEYDDATHPDAQPMVWSGLHLDLNTTPQSAAIYGFDLNVDDLPIAAASAAGTFNIDDLTLAVASFALNLKVAPDQQEAKIPGSLQEALRTYQVRGALAITGKADVPFQQLAGTKFSATIDLPGVAARAPQWNASLDRLVLRVRCDNDHRPSASPASAPVSQPIGPDDQNAIALTIEKLDATSGDTSLHLEQGTLFIDPIAGSWHARKLLGTLKIGGAYAALPTQVQKVLEHLGAKGQLDFTAAASGPIKPPPAGNPADALSYEMIAIPREFSIQPRHFPLPIDHISGSISIVPGLVRLTNMEGRYGVDKVFVVAARMPLAHIAQEVHFNEVIGSIDFAGKPQPYPPALEKILSVLRPSGPYLVSGNFTIIPKHLELTEYKIDLSSDHGNMAPLPYGIPLTNIRADAMLNGRGVESALDIAHFDAGILGGKMTATGQVRTGKPPTYQGQVAITNADLRLLAQLLADEGKKPTKLSGIASLTAQLGGAGPQGDRTLADNFRAVGEFEVVDGDYWEVPVLKAILASVKASPEAATVGQAAATFEIRDQKINLTDAAVSAPILGVEGSGIVGFNGQLDLRVIAVPLADWNEKIKKTGIPILSDTVGAIAGGVQKLLNDATSSLLYEFRVTGTIAKPQVTTVPAPILSDTAASLFGKMRTSPKDSHLLDTLRKK